jgi:hypothetical protein
LDGEAIRGGRVGSGRDRSGRGGSVRTLRIERRREDDEFYAGRTNYDGTDDSGREAGSTQPEPAED